MKLCIAFAVVALVAVASAAEFPEEYLGSWSVGKSENLDEYLTEKGYGWITRQMVKIASITKTFSRAGTGRFNAKIETTKGDVEWNNVPFNEEFEGKYVDGGTHKVSDFHP